MFTSNQKVTLLIGTMSFSRTVAYIAGGYVYLQEGGETFSNESGKMSSGKTGGRIVAA